MASARGPAAVARRCRGRARPLGRPPGGPAKARTRTAKPTAAIGRRGTCGPRIVARSGSRETRMAARRLRRKPLFEAAPAESTLRRPTGKHGDRCAAAVRRSLTTGRAGPLAELRTLAANDCSHAESSHRRGWMGSCDGEAAVHSQTSHPKVDPHHVAACWLMPNFQNPLGSLMPEDKQEGAGRIARRAGDCADRG